jgi:prepilin-type N-terminal cleavage/methylation domain-containing protein
VETTHPLSSQSPASRRAFSLLELLITIAIIALLAALLLPAISRAKESGRRVACLNNVRQINLALQLYADENEGSFPAYSTTQHWPAQLLTQYKNLAVLVCPTDRAPTSAAGPGVMAADAAARSYVVNGFQDPGVSDYTQENWSGFLSGPKRGTIREGEIETPSDTVLVGEKKSDTAFFTADLHQDKGSFYDSMEHGRHTAGVNTDLPGRTKKTGGSNFGFADGSAHYQEYGKAACPINKWGVTGYWRTNYAVCF